MSPQHNRNNLIHTHALTGSRYVGMDPLQRADGFKPDDFSGCLDAPDYIAAGSSRGIAWEILGEARIDSTPTFSFRD